MRIGFGVHRNTSVFADSFFPPTPKIAWCKWKCCFCWGGKQFSKLPLPNANLKSLGSTGHRVRTFSFTCNWATCQEISLYRFWLPLQTQKSRKKKQSTMKCEQRPFEDFFLKQIFVSLECHKISPSFCPKDEVSQTHRGHGLDKGQELPVFQVGAVTPWKLTWHWKSTIWRCMSYWKWWFSNVMLVFRRVVFRGLKPFVFDQKHFGFCDFSCLFGFRIHFLTRPLSFPTCYCQGRIICGRTLEQWCQHFQRLKRIKGEKNLHLSKHSSMEPSMNFETPTRKSLDSNLRKNGRRKGRMFGPGDC